jgi:hypothetical protein
MPALRNNLEIEIAIVQGIFGRGICRCIAMAQKKKRAFVTSDFSETDTPRLINCDRRETENAGGLAHGGGFWFWLRVKVAQGNPAV